MKKILFSAYSLGLGGIETALITLLKELEKEYEITLVLEKKEGLFLNELPNSINVVKYTPSKCGVIFIRKGINLLKKIMFYFKYHNKFSFACSFATYSKAGSYCARTASSNNALWVHNDYLTMYKNNVEDFSAFFNSVAHNKFKTLVFVSNEAREKYSKIFKSTNSKLLTCNNLINYKNILNKAEEEIELKKDNIITFLNIGRHDEHQKKLSRLLEAASKLKDDDYNFKIIMLGSGQDTEYYQKLVAEYKLEDYVFMLGAKKNPYPYYKISDAVILTSDYEGYPVVFVESLLLGKTILTTDVSDAKEDIENKYGIIMDKNSDSIYMAMKNYIENGYEIKNKFDGEKFNKEIIEKLIDIIENNNSKSAH